MSTAGEVDGKPLLRAVCPFLNCMCNVSLLGPPCCRVAQNLLGSCGDSPSREDLTTVKLLLENCIKLLGDAKSQVGGGRWDSALMPQRLH